MLEAHVAVDRERGVHGERSGPGIEAPIREIAVRAGAGTATIYRHFPTRADLILAVYRHQVEGLAEAGPSLLADVATPHAALAGWIDLFVDFLVTKHGLASVL